ncbi:MAG: sensor histidine kinase [Sarcina sp.]
MNFMTYLKDRVVFLLINFCAYIMAAAGMVITGFSISNICMFFIVWFLPLMIYILFEYFKFNRYYKKMDSVIDELDKQYLIAEVVKKPSFEEGKFIHEILRTATKSMNDYVRKYEIEKNEYRDYIESWVHEIKTPLASADLIIENNKNDITMKIQKELNLIDGFIEQVLYYSRSENVSKDYRIKEVSLQSIINSVIRSRAKDFIEKRISIDIQECDEKIFIDEKWLKFILNQIIQNSIKYSRDVNAKIKIQIEKIDNAVDLIIEDNGCGIDSKDIGRIFEKGFTGENGRKFSKSTGMGLYISKKICDGLGIGLFIKSQKGEYTKVELILPKGKYFEM